MSSASSTPFEELRSSLKEDWSAIVQARRETESKRDVLRALCEDVELPENTAVVCFGSLARGEWTSGSDVDWTLLVDGMSDPDHFHAVQRMATALRESGLRSPGPTGTFGQLSSSHQLIHHVGGMDDTNPNMTRRMLLLQESFGFPDANSIVLARVVRAVLERYIVSDPAVSALGRPEWRVPRFLLNDFVRYWRTIAVDYATKKWERAGKGWALRNIKLRMSRKLLFAKGLLLCFSCETGDHNETDPADGPGILKGIASHCFELARMSPLDVLCRALHEHADGDVARTVIGAYDRFLSTLHDEGQRKELEELDASTAPDSRLFREMREVSHDYSSGLEKLFFDSSELGPLTRKYGVF